MGNPNMVPGVSGNPAGRPPKDRSLTQLLVAQMEREILWRGEVLTGKVLMAKLVVETLVTGKVPILPEPYNKITPKEWMGLVMWMYQYIDPPATRLANADGSNLKIKVSVSE